MASATGTTGRASNVKAGNNRTELMHFQRVITFHQHIPAPITDANDERMDLEIGWRLPGAKDLKDSLLRIFVLKGRALLTFVPGDHVLHAGNLLVHPGPSCGLPGEQRYTPVGVPKSSHITRNSSGILVAEFR